MPKMKNLLTFILLIIGLKVFATPQISDILIYNGKEYEWSGFSPAFKYFELNNFQPPEEAVITTGNYSVFIMTYEIVDRKLYLIDVEIEVEQESEYGSDYPPDLVSKSVFKNYFPNQKRILMDFYSNIQLIPYGEIIEVTKNDWTDIHWEDYLVFEIKNGTVTTELDLNYKQFNRLKRKQFRAFKKTTEYQKTIELEEENLNGFNEFRPNKFTMDEYLELIVLRLIKRLK
tara:strand:+ start:50 stop:739 length:690 start_codon:yes stop_codon:yes gene_type:complete